MTPWNFQSQPGSFDANGWFDDAMRESLTIGHSSLESGSRFSGKMSCLQVYAVALNPARVKELQKCRWVEEEKRVQACPGRYELYDGMCYKARSEKQ